MQACASQAGGTSQNVDARYGGALADTPLAVETLPGWSEDDLAGIESALERQCELLAPARPLAKVMYRVPDAARPGFEDVDRQPVQGLAGTGGRQ